MAVTATKPKPTETASAAPASNRGAVATFSPPRLPWHPVVEERFGIDKSSWKALVEAIYPLATSVDSVMLALSYCRARKLDPFKKPVHIVPIWSKEKGKMVDTVWPGIAEHRTTAFRTKQFAGADPAEFGPMLERVFTGHGKEGEIRAEVRFPEWCQITVYRLIDGQRVPMPGPRVYWLETYSRIGRTDVPNDMWQKRPNGQLEKCAEAAALRRAFPEEIGEDLTADEAGSIHAGDGPRDITPPKPTRESVREEVAAEAQEAPSRSEPPADAPAAAEAAEVGFAVLTNDGEIAWAGGDPAEFIRQLCRQMEAVGKDAQMLAGLWESNEEQLAHCPPPQAKLARDKYALLTAPDGKLV